MHLVSVIPVAVPNMRMVGHYLQHFGTYLQVLTWGATVQYLIFINSYALPHDCCCVYVA